MTRNKNHNNNYVTLYTFEQVTLKEALEKDFLPLSPLGLRDIIAASVELS